MKKRRIIWFALTLFVLCNYLGIGLSGAWFVAGGTLGTADYETAKVVYLPSLEPTTAQQLAYGSLIYSDSSVVEDAVNIVPGDELIVDADEDPETQDLLKLENFSTTETSVRVKLDVELEETPGLIWQRVGSTNRYQYGMVADLMSLDGETVLEADAFLGLLEVEFCSDTCIWEYGTSSEVLTDPLVSFPSYWELKLSGGDTVPRLTAGTPQVYNVMKSVKLVAVYGSGDAEKQAAFDKFYTETYTGKTLALSFKYYAKQKMYMAWNLFSSQDINAVI